MNKYKIDITDLWNISFNKIDTPDGVQNIRTIVKKQNKECLSLLFSNGDIIECSIDHLIETENGWVKSIDLKYGDKIISLDDNVIFLDKINIGIKDTYDLEIDHNNHRYWSENISSHNTGKSSTAHAIIREIGGEALWINASMDRGIDVLRGRIAKFASQGSFDDKIKIVVMDEFDNSANKDSQKAFRGFLDEYSENCRFIFTGNYKENIIEPLLDRLEIYDFNSFNKKEQAKPIFDRLEFILKNEGVQYEQKQLIPIINTYYPSIRSMVGALQKFSKSGTLVFNEIELNDSNIFDKIMELVAPGTFLEMVAEVNKLNNPDNIYTFLYKNASKYFKKENYPSLVITIAKYQHMSSSVRDKNLNASACLTELMKFK